MKRISIVIIAALLFLLQTDAFAQESASPSATVTPTPIPYVLPYPGILPDHPLWFVKAVRDRIIGFLIADPLKKAEFNLLQADKRLSAGVVLIKKEKGELGVSVISKGENYFSDALLKVGEAKRVGKDSGSLVDQLVRSARKHQEAMRELIEKYPNVKNSLESELKRAAEHEKLAIELSR